MIKERPILFNSEMIRALLNGSKTQTRRIWKMPKGCEWYVSGNANGIETGDYCDINGNGWWNVEELPCPHGKIGHRLWVRESFSYLEEIDFFAANVPEDIPAAWYWADGDPEWGDWSRPKPSIHMPRWASRILLEITNVRVERLNSISEEDAIAEGGVWTDNGKRAWAKDGTYKELSKVNGYKEGWSHTGETHPNKCLGSARMSYANLWEKINGKGSWDLNPWVWVLEFKVIS